MMKTAILAITMVLGTSPLFAQMQPYPQQNGSGMDITQKKTKILSILDQRIALLQNKKNCINAATSKYALKSCHQNHKQQAQALRAQFKASRKTDKSNY